MKTDETTVLLIRELESYRFKKFELSEGQMIEIKVNSFQCKLKPENLETILDNLKKIAKKDFSKYVTIFNPYKRRPSDPDFKSYSLDYYCSKNIV